MTAGAACVFIFSAVFCFFSAIGSAIAGASCTGSLFGSAAACFAIGFVFMAAAGTPKQPPKRRIGRHYW